MSEQLTDLYTIEAIENMTQAWFGKKLPVNDALVIKVYQMIEDSSECSASIDKVPFKLSGVTGLAGKASSIAIATIKRVIQHAGKDKHYIMCLKALALKDRFEIELASMGQ